MRSRSTLLNHILMTNPDIIGLGETNAIYDSWIKYHWMKGKCKAINGVFNSRKKIFVDQINHNSKTPNSSILLSSNLMILVLVRNPEDSIRSILRLTSTFYSSWTEEQAAKYYLERLHFLLKVLNSKMNPKPIIIDSDTIINNSKTELLMLSKHLSLNHVLSEEYKIFDFTGISGDPTEKIHLGEITSIQNNFEKPLQLDLEEHLSVYNRIKNFNKN